MNERKLSCIREPLGSSVGIWPCCQGRARLSGSESRNLSAHVIGSCSQNVNKRVSTNPVILYFGVNQTFMNKKPDDGQGAFLVSALLHLETTNQ